MTPDWEYEKLLLERRIKFLELAGRLFHIFGPSASQHDTLRRWSDEYCDVSSRETLISSLKKLKPAKGDVGVMFD
jgi:hypothetical protein